MKAVERSGRAGPPVGLLLRQAPVLRLTVAASTVLGLVAAASLVVQALAIADLLAGAMPGAMPGAGQGHVGRDLWWLAVAAAVRAVCALAGEVVAGVGSSVAKAQMRAGLVRAVLHGGSAGGVDPAEVAAVAGRGMDSLEVYTGRCLPGLLIGGLAPLALAVAVGLLDWVSGLIVLVAIALFPLFGALVGRASMALARDRWAEVEQLGRRVADIFQGLPVLRALGRSGAQRSQIARANESLRQASMATLRLAFLSALVLDTLASVSVALVAVPLGLRLLDGSMRLPAALAVLIVSPEVFLPLRRASAQFHESTEGLAAAGRLCDLAGSSQMAASPGGGRLPGIGAVALDNVVVRFPGRDRPVLDGAGLVVEGGQTVALVGPNGAGKSTIMALLLGFVPPSSGAVMVGGTRLEDLDLAWWREHVTYLPERPSLLAATLADNLRLARRDASAGQMEEALRRAGGAGLLASLPDGLDTVLGEGGRPVSAGERQRIALARVFLRPASLYLLDEPTVHLDRDAERMVVEELRRELEDRAALVVTHRPAALVLADRVVHLDRGSLSPAADGFAVAEPVGTGGRS